MLNAGVFCDHVVLPAAGAIRMDAPVPFEEAALVGCAVVTGVGAALWTAGVEPGQSVAVFGAGGVGLNVVVGARLAGATRIVAIDPDERRLELARARGATECLLPGEPFEPVDYAFEVVGEPGGDGARRSLRSRPAGELVLVGAAARPDTMSFHPRAFMSSQQRITGCIYGSARPADHLPQLLDWVADGTIPVADLIGRRISARRAGGRVRPAGGRRRPHGGELRVIHRLEELRPRELEARLAEQPALVMALGTIEWHSHHLPLGLDLLKAQAIAERVADRAGAVLAPPAWWAAGGVPQPYTLRLPAEVTEPPLAAVLEGFAAMGFEDILVVNGHYGLENSIAVRRAALACRRERRPAGRLRAPHRPRRRPATTRASWRPRCSCPTAPTSSHLDQGRPPRRDRRPIRAARRPSSASAASRWLPSGRRRPRRGQPKPRRGARRRPRRARAHLGAPAGASARGGSAGADPRVDPPSGGVPRRPVGRRDRRGAVQMGRSIGLRANSSGDKTSDRRLTIDRGDARSRIRRPPPPGVCGVISHRGRICVKNKRLVPVAILIPALVVVALLTAGTGGAARNATFKAALISDVGRFNDKGFNQNQLTGLKTAGAKLGVQTRAIESHSAGDYIPNLASVARQGYDAIVAAGFLLADAEATVAKKFPNSQFAITDYRSRSRRSRTRTGSCSSRTSRASPSRPSSRATWSAASRL